MVAPNNRYIYLLAEDAGHSKIYRGKSSGGEAALAFDMKAGGYGNLVGADRSGSPVLIANFDSAVSPSEVVRIDLQRGNHQALTRFTADKMAQLDLTPVEHFWFDSKRGARIHNMIVRPPGEPINNTGFPFFARIVGVMLDNIRFPGATKFGAVPIVPVSSVLPGSGLKSPISLL